MNLLVHPSKGFSVFCEETGVEEDEHYIINVIDSIEEKFIGTNKLQYKHIYYISRFHKSCFVVATRSV